MTDRGNDEPLTSEELLRRARHGLSSEDASESTPTPPPSRPDPVEPRSEPAAAAADETPEVATRGVATSSSEESLIPADFTPAAARQAPPRPSDAEWAPELDPGSTAPEPRPSFWSQLWARRGWIIAAVFGIFAIGSFLNNSTSVDDLSPGDCFNDPGSEAVSEIDTVDCAEPHDLEMFATVQLVGDNGSWPGDLTLFTEAAEACFEHFVSYTGIGLGDETVMWDYTTFIPEPASWDDGGREALCTLFQIDASFNPVPATTSARAGA